MPIKVQGDLPAKEILERENIFVMDWYGLFDLQEESGDVIVTPTRPNGWDDGGTRTHGCLSDIVL